MSSDPRRGLVVALVVAALCAVWFVALIVGDARLAAALGMNRHAITFLAIVITVAASATALVFARSATVRDELLAGRRVLGRWAVDRATWAEIAPAALEADASERRSALLAVLLFLLLGFGGFALVDPEAAPGMILIGSGMALAVALAALLGRRVQRAHWRLASGEVIVGDRGLLSNGVLHVWALPLSSLVGARLSTHPRALVVTYGWFSRAGRQEVDVILPVPASAWETAGRVATALIASLGGRPPRVRERRGSESTRPQSRSGRLEGSAGGPATGPPRTQTSVTRRSAMKIRRFATILLSTALSASAALAQSLPGDWNWGVGGGITVISPDGTGDDGHGNSMRWTLVDPAARRYSLVWSHGYTDEAILSADGTSLTIINNVGARFTSVRRSATIAPASAEPGGGSTAAWTSMRPNSADVALAPLGETGFRPGRYVVLIAGADPDGHTVGTWTTHGPIDVRPGDHWIATATPSAGLRLEKGTPVAAVGAQRAAFSARNADIRSWQAICVLPEGRPPRPTCFAGSGSVRDAGATPPVPTAPTPPPGAAPPPPAAPVTFSRWKAITPNPGQSIAQPGRVMPLDVVGDGRFRLGRYQIHVADAGPHGLAVSSWKTFGPIEFKGRERWAAVLQPGVRVRMDRNGADLAAYEEPDAEHAMVWARNDDAGTWLAICVLPEGMSVMTNCFGGSGHVAYVPKASKASCEGTIEFRTPETKSPIVAQLRFTLDGARIDGSASMRSRSAEIERTIDASLTGTLDGEKITGRLEGRSEGRAAASGGNRNVVVGTLVAATVTFPFAGEWAGSLANGAAKGTHLLDRGGSKPMKGYWFGPWRATCR